MTIKDVERLLPNQRITAIGKAADMMWLAMGNDYEWYDELKKMYKIRSEYALHLQCSWRITREDEIIVASADFYVEYNDKTLFDLKIPELNKYLAENEVIVTGVETDVFGDLRVITNTNMILEVFVHSSYKREFWRLLTPDEHIVVFEEE